MVLKREAARQWVETDIEGIRISDVWKKNEDGSYFLHFQEGARFPMHDHDGWEQILMLTGRIRFGDVELSAGDTIVLGKGETHDAEALTDATFFVAHHCGITMV